MILQIQTGKAEIQFPANEESLGKDLVAYLVLLSRKKRLFKYQQRGAKYRMTIADCQLINAFGNSI